MPITTLQHLTVLDGQVSTIVAQVDSIENIDAATAAIKSSLGESKADVTTTQQNAAQAIDSLQSVQRISVVGFVMAIISAGIVIFLTMLMIVRERRREIGVLKAIGGSNQTIVLQFIVESIVLVMLGTVVGTGVALVSSNSMANALVSSNSTSDSQQKGDGMRRGVGIRLGGGRELEDTKTLIGTVTTTVGFDVIGYALLSAFVIAIVGSAAPAWLIARVRPAEVMRGE